VFPIHPRTQHIAEEKLSTIWTKLSQHKNIIIIPPASYFDIIQLEKNASVIITDSGGVQKEAYFFERPCIILRNETEWIEIVRHHAAILTDDNEEQILKAYETLQNKNIHYAPLFGDGHATQKIVTQIISTLEQKK
jgi:UDP-GlcNAc3NAcA epimerase